MKKLIATLTLLIAVAGFVPVTFAGFSMVPSSNDTRRQFNFAIKPGETKQDSVVIQNNNDSPLTLLLYGADSTHSNQGSFALVNRTATQRTIGKWVHFKDTTITLDPGAKQEIPFTVEMPNDATPGNYAGGIAAETTTVQDTKSKTNSGAGVVISSRLVVKLFISVPGEKSVKYNWDNYTRTETENGKQHFVLSYSNHGNAAIAIDPVIEITNFFGGAPQTVKLPETTLLQNETVTIPYDWDQQPFIGLYKATTKTTFWEYDIATNQNINPNVVSKAISFWIIPWKIAAGLIVLILVSLAYCTTKMLMMKKLKKNSREYEVESNETLVSIAEKAGVNWKKLAKLNHLKPPFAIKKGDKIKVPFKK